MAGEILTAQQVVEKQEELKQLKTERDKVKTSSLNAQDKAQWEMLIAKINELEIIIWPYVCEEKKMHLSGLILEKNALRANAKAEEDAAKKRAIEKQQMQLTEKIKIIESEISRFDRAVKQKDNPPPVPTTTVTVSYKQNERKQMTEKEFEQYAAERRRIAEIATAAWKNKSITTDELYNTVVNAIRQETEFTSTWKAGEGAQEQKKVFQWTWTPEEHAQTIASALVILEKKTEQNLREKFVERLKKRTGIEKNKVIKSHFFAYFQTLVEQSNSATWMKQAINFYNGLSESQIQRLNPMDATQAQDYFVQWIAEDYFHTHNDAFFDNALDLKIAKVFLTEVFRTYPEIVSKVNDTTYDEIIQNAFNKEKVLKVPNGLQRQNKIVQDITSQYINDRKNFLQENVKVERFKDKLENHENLQKNQMKNALQEAFEKAALGNVDAVTVEQCYDSVKKETQKLASDATKENENHWKWGARKERVWNFFRRMVAAIFGSDPASTKSSDVKNSDPQQVAVIAIPVLVAEKGATHHVRTNNVEAILLDKGIDNKQNIKNTAEGYAPVFAEVEIDLSRSTVRKGDIVDVKADLITDAEYKRLMEDQQSSAAVVANEVTLTH